MYHKYKNIVKYNFISVSFILSHNISYQALCQPLHVNNQRLFFPLKLPTTAEEPEHWIVRSPWPILIGREKPLVPSKWAASFPVFQAKTGLKRGCWNYLVQWRRRRVASIQGRKWFLDDPFSFLVVSTSSTDCDQFMWIVLEVFFHNSTWRCLLNLKSGL